MQPSSNIQAFLLQLYKQMVEKDHCKNAPKYLFKLNKFGTQSCRYKILTVIWMRDILYEVAVV